MEPGNVDGGGNSERSFQAVGHPGFPHVFMGGLGGTVSNGKNLERG